MATIPSGVLAGAAVSAASLAGVVLDLARALPVPSAVALATGATCLRVRRISAPRILATADVGAIGAVLVTEVQRVARACDPGDASAGLYGAAEAARIAVPTSASPALTRSYALARALSAGVEVACLGEAFLAEARTGFSDRRAATEARARITAAYDAAADRLAATLGQEVLGVLATVSRAVSGHLVRQAASLQPIVRVEAGRSFPSTALAWSLYGDPARADELVLRNRCGTPLFMPATIEAVSPKGS